MKYISYYLHIASYTLLGQLIIYGVQWPILMAWGYTIHPLSLLGNILFMPLIFTLIAILSCIFLCYICSLINTPLFTIVRYLIDIWLTVLPYSIDGMYWIFPCPHISVVIAIPIITGYIAWYVPRVGYKIIALILFFGITSIGLKHATPTCGKTSVHTNMSVYRIGSQTVLYYSPKHTHARYTDNWIQYTLLPTLRCRYGTETVDYVVYTRRYPAAAMRKLGEHTIIRHRGLPLQYLVQAFWHTR